MKKHKNSIFVAMIVLALLLVLVGVSNVYGLDPQKDFVYLSDISYIKDKSFASGNRKIRLDENMDSQLITLNINGTEEKFIKGITAWATSEIVYDISSYDYDYFTAYIGVDASEKSDYFNTGVKFYIYKSEDGVNWGDPVETSNKFTASTPAKFIKIDIKDTKFIKLVADDNSNDWWADWNDEAVYANAKLIKKDYIEDNSKVDFIKTVEEYDQIIQTNYASNQEISGEYELTLLKREFVKNVGYSTLQAFVKINNEYKDIVYWLMNDVENLRLYTMGGTPDGSYINALRVLSDLYNTYKDDLSIEDTTTYGIKLKDLYKKMMFSLSLTHSTNVALWVTGTSGNANGVNDSNAINRYSIFKELHSSQLLDNNVFESLEIEEMRFVMNNIIDDESIKWLNALSRKKNDRNPYSYLQYKFGYDYSKSDYYDANQFSRWDNKYNLTQYNISYLQGYPKLWVVFEEGGVCGAIAKTGSNLNGVNGIPSSVVGQPGHAAYIYYSLNNKGEGVWNLYNDVSGWAKSGRTEKLGIRMPNGWGIGSYASGYPVTYILLAQANLNDFENYQKSEAILLLANTYKTNQEELYKIYRQALTVEPLNFDAWLGLVNLYSVDNTKTDNDYIKLTKEIVDTLKFYPLPMYDLLRIIEPKLTNSEAILEFTILRKNALTAGTTVTSNQSIQVTAVKQVANYLLGNTDSEIATFSFDGENAGIIKLSENKFGTNGVAWEYSLDGKSTWISAKSHNHKLTESEIRSIDVENDISIHIVGTDYSNTNIYTIDITKATLPSSIYANDYENKVIGATDIMEWKFNENDEWTLFEENLPDLSGTKTIMVRVRNTGTTLHSDTITLSFTKEIIDDTNKYISVDNLTIDGVSTEEANRGERASNVIDGNINTIWHTLWNGSDTEKYITIKLKNKTYVSGIEYFPRQDTGNNGKVTNAKILVSEDGQDWKEVVASTNWDLSKAGKKVTFSESVLAQYVKIIGVKTSGNYMSAAMINLYEDTTKQVIVPEIPTPTPTPSPSPSPTPIPDPTPSPSPSPTPTPDPTPSPSPTPTSDPTLEVTPTPTPSDTPTIQPDSNSSESNTSITKPSETSKPSSGSNINNNSSSNSSNTNKDLLEEENDIDVDNEKEESIADETEIDDNKETSSEKNSNSNENTENNNTKKDSQNYKPTVIVLFSIILIVGIVIIL